MAGFPPQGATKHRRWFIDSLKEVHHTRFLLQPNALELFMHDRSNALLSFPTHQARPRNRRKLRTSSVQCRKRHLVGCYVAWRFQR